MNATIAWLHQIDPVAVGLGDNGRPGNYHAPQVARLSQQYLADTEAGRIDDMDRLVEWLPAHRPRRHPALRVPSGVQSVPLRRAAALDQGARAARHLPEAARLAREFMDACHRRPPP